jgi:Sulfotransferase domain.
MLQSQDIIDDARAQTGLTEFHSDTYRHGLDLLTANARESADISEQGIAILRFIWTRNLANRLKIDDYHRRHPDLADSPVEAPIFQFGMPRTGTTVLSNLLATDPALRSMLSWESNDPVPPAAKGSLKSDPRCIAAKTQDADKIKANPEMAKRHFEPADAPTECTFIHGHDFKACMLESLAPAPTYTSWLSTEADLTEAYAYEKRFMQVLQHHTGGTWSVKMPSHALFLDSLVKVFPDARLVWIHRDPYKATASLLSLIEAAQREFVKKTSIEYIRSAYVPQMFAHIARARAFDRANPGRIAHVSYANLIADPIAEMKALYVHLGQPFTKEAEAGMQAYLAATPQNKHGAHSYGLEEFGVDPADLDEGFADYVEHFRIPREG